MENIINITISDEDIKLRNKVLKSTLLLTYNVEPEISYEECYDIMEKLIIKYFNCYVYKLKTIMDLKVFIEVFSLFFTNKKTINSLSLTLFNFDPLR